MSIELAKQALTIMVLDLEYDAEEKPANGWAPLRHQILWDDIENVLGKEAMAEHLAELEKAKEEGNHPVKTNPIKDPDRSMNGNDEKTPHLRTLAQFFRVPKSQRAQCVASLQSCLETNLKG